MVVSAGKPHLSHVLTCMRKLVYRGQKMPSFPMWPEFHKMYKLWTVSLLSAFFLNKSVASNLSLIVYLLNLYSAEPCCLYIGIHTIFVVVLVFIFSFFFLSEGSSFIFVEWTGCFIVTTNIIQKIFRNSDLFILPDNRKIIIKTRI